MTKILMYLFSYLFTLAGGVVIGMLIDSDNVYKTTIGKIKQKGRGNTQESDLVVEIPPQNKRESRREKWKRNRQERKQKKGKSQ